MWSYFWSWHLGPPYSLEKAFVDAACAEISAEINVGDLATTKKGMENLIKACNPGNTAEINLLLHGISIRRIKTNLQWKSL